MKADKIIKGALAGIFIGLVWLSGAGYLSAQEKAAKPLDLLNVSYASVTGRRIPLWIAKDAGLLFWACRIAELEEEGFFTRLYNQ